MRRRIHNKQYEIVKTCRSKIMIVVALFAASVSVIAVADAQVSFDPPINFLSGDGVLSMVKEDFNGDGFLDFATSAKKTDTVAIHLNNQLGGFNDPWDEYHVGPFPAPINNKPLAVPYGVASGDFNGNGWPDLVVANSMADTLSVLLNKNDGSGTFSLANEFSVRTGTAEPTTPIEPSAVVAADVNGDGVLDLVTANLAGARLSILKGVVDSVTGFGTGMFEAAVNVWAGGSNPISLAAGDFDGDTCADLVVAINDPTLVQVPGMPIGFRRAQYNVSVLLNRCDGTGTFFPAQLYEVGSNPVQVIAKDLNGDGILDLATANASVVGVPGGGVGGAPNPGRSWVSILLGNGISPGIGFPGIGDGTFSEAIQVDTDQSPSTVAAADLDNDGDTDLVTGHLYTPGAVAVMLNNGIGGFAPPVTFSPGGANALLTLMVGDFDGDTDIDIIGSSKNNDEFVFLKNQLVATPAPPPTPAPGPTLPSVGGIPVLTPEVDMSKIRWKLDKGAYQFEFQYTVTNNGDGASQGLVWVDAFLDGDAIDRQHVVGLAVGRTSFHKGKLNLPGPVAGKMLTIEVVYLEDITNPSTTVHRTTAVPVP